MKLLFCQKNFTVGNEQREKGIRMHSDNIRFWILISLITISGFSQGMLLPLIAIILEQNGISSSVNGLHATGIYLGILIASPFMEKPLRKFGFKPIILAGGLLVIISFSLFPFWQALWFWFMLRVTVGIGDQMLHFGIQTWITTTTPKEIRGRRVAYYGMFFGLGFAIGPVMTRFLEVHIALPFILSAILSALVWSLMLFVRNEMPEKGSQELHRANSVHRFVQTLKIAWVALLPGFAYGFLESALHSIFPVYGLRIGHNINLLSFIIPCFALGSLITQIPLGILSDRIGRRKTLLYILSGAMITFAAAAFFEQSALALFAAFTIAGMLVGSLYSLGMAFMTDMLPSSLLPSGNILISILFSIGSISGPFLSGLFLDLLPDASFFTLIASMLFIVFLSILFAKQKPVS